MLFIQAKVKCDEIGCEETCDVNVKFASIHTTNHPLIVGYPDGWLFTNDDYVYCPTCADTFTQGKA